MSNGKTYEIICGRGNNRVECPYKKKDRDLHCPECSFAKYIERIPIKQTNNEPRNPDIQQ